MTDQLNLLLGDRHAWAWVNDSSTPKWALTIGYVRRPTRRWRMLRNFVRAYDEMLAGKGRNVSSVALAGEDSAIAEERLSMPVQVMSRTSAERMLEAHDGDTDKVHTPFLSRHEVSWGRDTTNMYSWTPRSFLTVPVACRSPLTRSTRRTDWILMTCLRLSLAWKQKSPRYSMR